MDTQPQIEIGMPVRIKDLRGEWKVQYMNLDGSVCCYGGTLYKKSFRNFPLYRIVPIRKRSK